MLRALCCLLLGLGAACTPGAGGAPADSTDVLPSFPGREPAPLMAQSLLLKPVDRGRLTSTYGTRSHPFSKRRQMHRGIDWAAPRGTTIRAAGDGVVVEIGRHSSYGRYLRIDHGGTIETAYAHLERYASTLRRGLTVHQGDELGRVGSTGRATGPHLHYEVLVAGNQIDPLAFAPAALADADDPADAASASEFGIGGPDIEVAADAGAGANAGAPAPEAIDGSAVIWVDDLLRRYGP
jgi:murein DD-endopeptidase MepM/ murein hydrolase activator NlpD